MRSIPAPRSVLAAALLLAAGCHTIEPPAVPVTVVDAETGAPVRGAEVRVWRPDPRGPEIGNACVDTTGPDGVARVRPRAASDVGLVVGVSAPGYLPEQHDFRRPAAATESGKLEFIDVATSANPLTIAVYAGPRPVVNFIVPNGYRGLVLATVKVDPAQPPGVREFAVPVDAEGRATVVGPAVLQHALGLDYRARYADGTELRRDAKGLDLGFKWLRTDGDVQYFVVGSQTDVSAFQRQFAKESAPRPATGGGGGGGKGGGRHGGGGRGGMGGGMGGGVGGGTGGGP